MGSTAIAPAHCVTSNSAPSPRLVSENRSVIPISSKRIPALDGLRGLAVLLVLLRHSVAGTETISKFWMAVLRPLRLTWSGVDLFFVLSGFLIGGILLDSRRSPRYFRTFYIRRAFRILPVYYIFLALYFARHLSIHLVPGPLGDTSPLPIPFLSFMTFTHNFWMASFGLFGAWAIAPTWSLAVEEQFYLTVPFIIRCLNTRRLYIVLACIILSAPIVRAILPHLMQNGAFANYVLMPCRADALSMGVVAALLYRSPNFREWIEQNFWAIRTVTIIAFAGIVFFTYRDWDQYSPPLAVWGLSCLAVFYTCILLSVVCGLSPFLERALRFRILLRLGTLSYCTYLIHPVLIQAARTLLRSHTHLGVADIWPLGGILGVGAALVLSSISWKVLESPLLRRAHQYEF